MVQESMRTRRIAAAAIALCGITGALHAQATEQWQLSPGVGTTTQRFGNAMAAKGDVLVVGAPYEDTNGTDSGAVDVYRFDATTGSWQFEQQLFPSDPETYARFGAAVDVSGDVLVVGAPYKDTTQGLDGGQFYVFRYSAGSGTWSQEQKLLPSNGIANDHFGASVAVSGTAALCGAPQADTSIGVDSGSVIAFRYKNPFLKWVEEKQLLDNDGAAYDTAGTSISLDGSLACISSPAARESAIYNAGSVATWTVSGSTWTQGAELTAPTAQGYAAFGTRLRVNADLLVVTAPLEDETPTTYDSGAVYLFRLVSGSYVLETRLTGPAPVAYQNFGSDAAVEKDLVVVGSQIEDTSGQYDSGTAYLYRKGRKPTWFYDDQLAASDIGTYDHFGTQVVLSNGSILVAADSNDTAAGSDFGVIYGFFHEQMTLTITPPDPLPGETMTFSAFRGAEGEIVMITIEDVGGVPLFLPLVTYVFAADHTFTFTADAPNPLFGLSIGMRAYKVSSTGPVTFSALAFVGV